MTKVMCIQCSMEFPNDASFQEHKKSGHLTVGKLLDTPGPPPSPEMIEAIKRIEEKAKEAEKGIVVKTPVGDVTLEPPKPVKLEYRYTGECKTCRKVVTTLEIDIDEENHFVIAHCTNCNVQLESRKEKKL